MYFVVGMTVMCASVAAQEGLPPREMPLPLLSAPVNATWAAAHIDYWRDKGFRGFIFTGILDGLATDIWSIDGDLQSADEDDLLAREMHPGLTTLNSGGIDRNFLQVPLAPELDFFTGSEAAETAVENLSHAVAFCRITGMRGIAIDTRSTSLFYNYSWDGYDADNVTKGMLDAGAERLGRRIGRAILREMPTADILLVADTYETWSPLWIALIRGITRAAKPSTEAAIHLMLQGTFPVTEPVALAATVDTAKDVLYAHLDSRDRATWDKRGYFSAGMRPIVVVQRPQGPVVLPACTQDAFRRQLNAAMLSSGRYCWVEGAEKTWWRVDEEEAEIFKSLFQLGWDIPAQIRPPLPDIDEFAVKTHLSAFNRVAPFRFNGVPCYVLTTAGNSAMAFPQGLKQDLSLKVEKEQLRLLDLVSGEERTLTAAGGSVVVPDASDKFLVLDGLPLYPLTIEAAIWMNEPQTPEPGLRDIPLRYGFEPRTGLGVSGVLNATVPEGFSILPGKVPFDLEAWQPLAINGLIRGRFELGKPVSWSLVLASPTAPPVLRSFQTTPSPPQIWQRTLDGLASYPPTVSTTGGNSANIFVPVTTGELASFTRDGDVRWVRRFSAGIRGGATVSPGSFGQWLVTTVDGAGRIRAFNADGLQLWEKDYGGECLMPGTVASALDMEPGEEVITAYSDGRVIALSPAGTELWQRKASTGPGWLMAVPLLGGIPVNILVLRGGSSPALDSIDVNGELRWRTTLKGAPACPPAILDVNGDTRLEVVVPYTSGAFEAIDPAAGTSVATGVLPITPPLLSLTTVELIKNDGIEILAGASNEIVALDNKMNVLWKHNAVPAAPPTAMATPAGARIVIPLMNASLQCLDGTGQLLWEDAHAAAPAAVPAVIAQLTPTAEPEYLYTCRDRFLRMLAID